MSEKVNHPSHYNMGGEKEADGTAKYEVIKLIEDWDLGFCLGNALKYILRAPHKGNEDEDLAKAIWYLDRAHANAERGGSPRHPRLHPYDAAKAWGLLNDGLLQCVSCIWSRHTSDAQAWLTEYKAARVSSRSEVTP